MTLTVKIEALLAKYTVLSDDGGMWVICRRCGERALVGAASEGADLGNVTAWGAEHKCQPQMTAEAWERAAQEVYEALQGYMDDQRHWTELLESEQVTFQRAFAAGIRAVALDLRSCYEGDN